MATVSSLDSPWQPGRSRQYQPYRVKRNVVHCWYYTALHCTNKLHKLQIFATQHHKGLAVLPTPHAGNFNPQSNCLSVTASWLPTRTLPSCGVHISLKTCQRRMELSNPLRYQQEYCLVAEFIHLPDPVGYQPISKSLCLTGSLSYTAPRLLAVFSWAT